jgi:hypothetical protein
MTKGSVSIDKRVRAMINSRLEYKSCGITSAANSTAAGTVFYLTTCPEDDTVNGRTGTLIRPVKLELRHRAHDATNVNFVRVVLFRDNMNQGALPVVADVLLNASVTAPYNYINVEQQKRFNILFDKTIGLTPSGFNAQAMSHTIKLKGVCHFTGTSDLLASAGRGTLFALILSSTDGATMTWSARTIYTDA